MTSKTQNPITAPSSETEKFQPQPTAVNWKDLSGAQLVALINKDRGGSGGTYC
ncbi:hypothetical protein ACI2KT_36490 [Ensifer adhaerens]|uniref:hypothetical protein n=1 Tax=Ensifer adhaerens TaxID=106592 RepID=UPI00384D8364